MEIRMNLIYFIQKVFDVCGFFCIILAFAKSALRLLCTQSLKPVVSNIASLPAKL